MFHTSFVFADFSEKRYCNVFADEYYMDYEMINEQDVHLNEEEADAQKKRRNAGVYLRVYRRVLQAESCSSDCQTDSR